MTVDIDFIERKGALVVSGSGVSEKAAGVYWVAGETELGHPIYKNENGYLLIITDSTKYWYWGMIDSASGVVWRTQTITDHSNVPDPWDMQWGRATETEYKNEMIVEKLE